MTLPRAVGPLLIFLQSGRNSAPREPEENKVPRALLAAYQWKRSNSLLESVIMQKCIQSGRDILLQIAVEELIIIQMIDPVRKEGKSCGIVGRGDIRCNR